MNPTRPRESPRSPETLTLRDVTTAPSPTQASARARLVMTGRSGREFVLEAAASHLSAILRAVRRTNDAGKHFVLSKAVLPLRRRSAPAKPVQTPFLADALREVAALRDHLHHAERLASDSAALRMLARLKLLVGRVDAHESVDPVLHARCGFAVIDQTACAIPTVVSFHGSRWDALRHGRRHAAGTDQPPMVVPSCLHFVASGE